MSFQRLSEGVEGPITEFVVFAFAARATSACHWSWTAVGDDQRPTDGDSRLRGTREPLQQATDVRAPRQVPRS